MDTGLLQKIGLTEGESRVYLSLLKIGKSTIGDIIKEAQVSNSKVYDILDRLNKKGLVGIVIENNKKSFEAKSPEIISGIIDLRKKEINEVNSALPSLKEIYHSQKSKQEAEILKGLAGIRSFADRLIEETKKGETIYILGVSEESREGLENFYQEWHKRRVKKGCKVKMLLNYGMEELGKQRQGYKDIEIKILPKSITTPISVDFASDLVGMLVFGEDPFCISIKNSKIVQNYEQYFNLLWKLAKP